MTHIPIKLRIASSLSNYKDVTAAIVLLLLIQISLAIKLDVFYGSLVDPDVYMWLIRALQLHEHGNWFDHVLPRVNPPIGYEQHWTRPFDLVLISGAWLGSTITDFGHSLYIWSILVSPLLGVLALFSFLWLLNPILGDKENGVAGLLFVTQMGIISSFVVGRADHQSLILLFFILSLVIGLRMLLRPFSWQTCYLAALLSALAIWVSVEAILFPLLTISAFGFFWLLEESYISRKLAHYTSMLFLLLIVFRTIEFGPSQLLEPTLDQISIVYITLFGLIAVYWVFIYIAERNLINKTRLSTKLSCAVIWTISIAVLLELCFPGFFAGPWGDIDGLFRRVHLARIKELQPVLSLTALSSGDLLEPLLTFSLWIGIIIPGIPALFYLILKSRSQARLYWAFIGIHCLVYIPLSLNEVRFATYTEILMLPGYIWFVVSLIQYIGNKYKEPSAGLMRVLVLVSSVVIFILPDVLFGEYEENGDTDGQPSLIPISAYLSDPDTWGDRPHNLLAFTDFGPELLYRTPHSVFSIPSHRHHTGYTDSYNFMTAIDDAQALQLAIDRQIDLILIYPNGREKIIYTTSGDTKNLYTRLSSNEPPYWLEQIKLPSDLTDSFKLYQVKLPSEPGNHIVFSANNSAKKVQ